MLLLKLMIHAAVAACAIAVCMSLVTLRNVEAAPSQSIAARLQHLEDREQIIELITAYGTTLDQRDFDAFGKLFADDAVYISGPTSTQGRAAIQSQLEKIITGNPAKLPPPNVHLLFNPSIQIQGDHATVRSHGAYVAPDAMSKTTQMVFFVGYDDLLVRKQGRWLFKKRAVKSGAALNAAK
jgi:uncharacterized protein (TIGR02246 family)